MRNLELRRLMGSRWTLVLLIASAWAGPEHVFADDGGNPPETEEVLQDEPVGCPLAPGMIELLEDEINGGLKRRRIESRFAQFKRYAATTLDQSARAHRSSDLSGNCRLSWYDALYRNPIKATAEGERFTRELHQAVLAGRTGLASVLEMSVEKLDAETATAPGSVDPASAEEALECVQESLAEARTSYLAAVEPLTPAERNSLERGLYPALAERSDVGHTLSDRRGGRRMLDLLQKMDRSSLYGTAQALMPLTDERVLKQLRKLPEDESVEVDGAGGPVVRRISTRTGDIVIGGKGDNVYELDRMPGVCAVIDLGGDDEYREGSVSVERPILVIIDLAGGDNYVASAPGAQGGAVFGVSMLLDLEGNDTYRARDVAQGSALGGVGILVDYAGDDGYAGYRRVQGQALGGIGILIDREGDDLYHAAMWGQGFGGPLGFGLFDDLAGDDQYTLGGLYINSFKPETPGYEGWGQGVGAGLREVANGGIGVFLEGDGDDRYEYDYLSHGGGYWCGVGLARDFGGNDHRLHGTQQEFHGRKRREPLYQRYTCGWGCHYAIGFCFDDGGDDVYGGTIMGLGFAWDMSVGVLCDFAGNDRYEAARQNTQGSGAQAGLGILFEYEGDDVYLGPGQGYASSGISYHPPSMCGGNFSFVVDYGGKDKYGCGVANNSYSQRGSQGSFIIDRPSREEETELRAGNSPDVEKNDG